MNQNIKKIKDSSIRGFSKGKNKKVLTAIAFITAIFTVILSVTLPTVWNACRIRTIRTAKIFITLAFC